MASTKHQLRNLLDFTNEPSITTTHYWGFRCFASCCNCHLAMSHARSAWRPIMAICALVFEGRKKTRLFFGICCCTLRSQIISNYHNLSISLSRNVLRQSKSSNVHGNNSHPSNKPCLRRRPSTHSVIVANNFVAGFPEAKRKLHSKRSTEYNCHTKSQSKTKETTSLAETLVPTSKLCEVWASEIRVFGGHTNFQFENSLLCVSNCVSVFHAFCTAE